ncbi:MAG: M48 family metalloprotease [Thermodesulfobacteriota bacterium]
MKTAYRKRTDLWRRLAAVALIFLLWEILPVQQAAAFLSTEDERVMGQKFLESIKRQLQFVDDGFSEDYLNDLGQFLLLPMETRPFPFQFYLARDHSLNAFAGPGGHIFVFSGLVSVMDSVDELAAVLCHEVAHVSARHLAERLDQMQKIGLGTLAGMLAGILMGGQAGAAVMSGTVAAGIQKQLAYSREDERQADQLGFQYMSQTGFDPGGMLQTLTKLEKGSWYGANTIPPYLLTHPSGPERMSNIESLLSTLSRKQDRSETRRFRDLFPFFKVSVGAKSGDPHEMEARFRKELERDPDSVLAHFGMGIVLQGRSENERAVRHFQEALKGRPDSAPVLRKLAESYQWMGRDREAVQILEKAVRSDRQDRSGYLLLAKSYQNLEDHGQAIRLYERLLLMKPVKDEVYYDLGVSYGRENRLALAHYNFGVYFKRTGERNKARFHFQKAEELAKGDPGLAAKIQSEMKEMRLR